MAEEKKQETKEDRKARIRKIQEKNLKLVEQKNARVVTIETPLGFVFISILKQFDLSYNIFKKRLGEVNGVNYAEGEEIIKKAQEITVSFSELTEELCKLIDFKYYKPKGLEMLKKEKAA